MPHDEAYWHQEKADRYAYARAKYPGRSQEWYNAYVFGSLRRQGWKPKREQ